MIKRPRTAPKIPKGIANIITKAGTASSEVASLSRTLAGNAAHPETINIKRIMGNRHFMPAVQGQIV
jgi:hypothetical protein